MEDDESAQEGKNRRTSRRELWSPGVVRGGCRRMQWEISAVKSRPFFPSSATLNIPHPVFFGLPLNRMMAQPSSNWKFVNLQCLPHEPVCCSLVANSCPALLRLHGQLPTRLLCPWNFPDKNTGVSSHFLLQRIFPTQDPHLLHCRRILYRWATWQLLNCLGLFATPWTVAHQAPLSVGFFLARLLDWIAISSSKGSSWPRAPTRISCIAGEVFTAEPPGMYSIIW